MANSFLGVTQLLPNTEIVTLTASTTLGAQTVTETATTVIASEVVCGNGLSLCNGQCKDLTSDASNCGACGNVCSSGACQNSVCVSCNNPFVCGGSLPNCNGSGDCYCYSVPGGSTVCSNSSGCSQSCGSDADCGDGNFCAINTCCGGDGSNCKDRSAAATCANVASAAKMFRARRGLAGYVLWDDGSYGPPTPLE
ncbi:hypothetical protein LTR17_004104 [Elasticomyces elasticus]|nr:hypothetical protein LTR17_004104 [Elasticomyces elasticus]